MTREQIEELRRHAEYQEECIDGKACSHSDELLRLLKERAALLAFAKRMDHTLDAYLYQAERAECAAAIALAEADPEQPPAPALLERHEVVRVLAQGLTVSAEDFKAAAAGMCSRPAIIPPVHTSQERLRLWAKFLFCYQRPDRERDDSYLAELWTVFEEHYPQE